MSQDIANKVLKLIQSRHLDEATALLQSALQHDPKNPSLLHLSATIAAMSNQLSEALRLFDQVLAIAPRSAKVVMDRGNVLLLMGELGAARAALEQALRLDSSLPEIYANLAQVETRLGETEKAKQLFTTATQIKPSFVDAWVGLGNVLIAQDNLVDAIGCYAKALAYDPRHVEAQLKRGSALTNLKRHAEALGQFEQLTRQEPNLADAHALKGHALLKVDRGDQALAALDQALALKPNDADWMTWRAHVLVNLGRFDEALITYDEALILGPDNPWAWEGKGVAHFKAERFSEALECFEAACQIVPAHGGTHANRGNALRELGRLEESLEAYQAARMHGEDTADIRFTVSVVQLLLGRWRESWPLYEARWEYSSGIDRAALPQDVAIWEGDSSIAGKRILLAHEQGLGDSLMAVRYAQQVSALGAEVWLWVPKSLEKILGTAPGVAGVITREDHGKAVNRSRGQGPVFDAFVPMMGLLGIFETTPDTVPFADKPYLSARPEWVNRWSSRIHRTESRPVIGLMWRGQSNQLLRARSIDLPELDPILSLPIDFVSLQQDLPAQDLAALMTRPVRHFGNEQKDFADAAAIIHLCDAVITIDTSMAHLAGAMGKRTWILLPSLPDWRWLQESERSVWYPDTTTLVRQTRYKDWQDPVNELKSHLTNLIEALGTFRS